MDEDIVIDDTIKEAFNLGYRMAETAEGRKKALNLVKGKENLPVSQGITAGVKQWMVDDLTKEMEEKLGKGPRLRH